MTIISRLEKTPTQKLIVASLVIFSVGTIVVGFLQFKTFLEKPFFEDKLVEDKVKIRGPLDFYQYLLEQKQNNKDLTSLQKRDSDMDGLTDYQETYVYHTNPYAADTDFDGVSDKEEIAKGTDPNCANNEPGCLAADSAVTSSGASPAASASVGAAVSGQGVLNDTTQTQIKDLANQVDTLNSATGTSPDLTGQSFSQLLPEQKAEIKQYYTSLQPADLRQLLISQGFPAEQINTLSDDDLQKTLQQLLAQLE